MSIQPQTIANNVLDDIARLYLNTDSCNANILNNRKILIKDAMQRRLCNNGLDAIRYRCRQLLNTDEKSLVYQYLGLLDALDFSVIDFNERAMLASKNFDKAMRLPHDEFSLKLHYLNAMDRLFQIDKVYELLSDMTAWHTEDISDKRMLPNILSKMICYGYWSHAQKIIEYLEKINEGKGFIEERIQILSFIKQLDISEELFKDLIRKIYMEIFLNSDVKHNFVVIGTNTNIIDNDFYMDFVIRLSEDFGIEPISDFDWAMTNLKIEYASENKVNLSPIVLGCDFAKDSNI